MSKEPNETTHEREHATTRSYIIGFVLSLVFTIIPYYMVSEHVVSGNALLATILAFGLIQMIIQLVFFLHLGREKKPYWQVWFLLGTVGAIFVVVGGSIWIMGHLHYNMTPVTPESASKKLIEDEGIAQLGGEKTGACEGQHTTHKVMIKGNTISPSRIVANMCDKITFISEDGETRYIMFGSFDEPEAYGGEDMLTITGRRPKTIVLNEPGTHQFHDHKNAETTGQFTVASE